MAKTNNSKLFLVLFLGTLSAFGPFVTDLYLPALPYMSEYFSVEAYIVQLTLMGSMVGLAVGQLVVGPISDKYGRKRPIIVSLVVYLISTILIILIPNIYVMIFLRFIQGLSSSGAVVVSRAVAADLYEGNELRAFFGLLMAVNGMAPIISPIFGSVLLQFVSWKGIFVTLALIGIVLLSVSQKFDETLAVDRRIKGSVKDAYATIPLIFKNRIFMTLVLTQSFAICSLFGYIAASPFILQTEYGLSSFAYSICFALNGVGIIIGTRVSNFFSNKKAIFISISGLISIGLLISLALSFKANVFVIEVLFFLLMLFTGIIFPAMSSLAMASERRYAGAASAILGFFPFLFGGIVSPLVGLGDVFVATSITLVSTSIIAMLLFRTIKNKIN